MPFQKYSQLIPFAPLMALCGLKKRALADESVNCVQGLIMEFRPQKCYEDEQR